MKTIKEYITEELAARDAQLLAEQQLQEAAESIKSEKDFREYAEKKFKEAFKDDLDEKKMNDTIDGILNDHKEEVENGDWGKLVGILNKSF
jgi:hypothetical protein